LRAGLLSQPEVIRRVNRQFVSTTLSYPDLKKRGEPGDALAKEILRHWQIPLVLVFLTPEGRFITKLSSLDQLNEVHPETTKRNEAPQRHSLEGDAHNAHVFLEHLTKHFPDPARP
jgi:hypothetical protein